MKNQTQNPKLQEFLDRYKALVDELQVDLAIYPVFLPDGNNGFKVVVQSSPIDITPKQKKEEGIPTPFVPEK